MSVVSAAFSKKKRRLHGQPGSWLFGRADTAELIRSLDWSDTALGPIDEWSPHATRRPQPVPGFESSYFADLGP